MEEPHGEVGPFGFRNEAEPLSELEAQAELHNARVVRSGEKQGLAVTTVTTDRRDGAGPRVGEITAYGVQLRVVEDVEVFPAEFEGIAFLDRETLEETEVKVQASRKGELVAAEGAYGQSDRLGKSIGIVAED